MDEQERDDFYGGCALPVGMKAAFWRSYFEVNLHERIQRRSIMDEVLQELERCEERILLLQALTQQYVTFVETRSMDLWQVAQMYHAMKEALAVTRCSVAIKPFTEGEKR